MPDEPYDQVSFGDRISARRQERAQQAQQREDPRIEALLGRIAALEAWRANLQGANGIAVNGQIISYTPPPPSFTAFTGDITVCVDNGDGTFSQATAAFVNGLLMYTIPSEE